MEQAIISGVAHDLSEARITVVGVPDKPGEAASIFRAVADAQVNVDMIVQNIAEGGRTDMTFSCPTDEVAKARAALDAAKAAGRIEFQDIESNEEVAKVSIVGIGMRSHVGVAATMFRALSEEGINIQMITTSEIKTSVVIDEKYMELAVRALHKAFDLDQDVA